MPELHQDYTMLTVMQGLTALAWLASALAAWVSHHAYRQRTDLLWLIAFLLLAGVSAGNAYVASSWADNVAGIGEIQQVRFDLYTSIRLAALELAGAATVFFVFRRARVTF